MTDYGLETKARQSSGVDFPDYLGNHDHDGVNSAPLAAKSVEESMLSQDVQDKLATVDADNATAIGTIGDLATTATNLVGAVNEVKETADAAYVKPETGIPSTDFSAAVGTSLGKADSAVQPAAIANMVTQAADAAAAGTILVSGGADKTSADSTVAIANVPTMADAGGVGELVLTAAADKALSKSGKTVNSFVQNITSGAKLARGGTTAVTGTLEIESGLATVVAVYVGLAEAPAATGAFATATIPDQGGADAGKFTACVWKGDYSAADAAKNVTWIAVGT